MAKKKTNKNIPLPILILICVMLLFAMYLSLSTLALAIWGDSVMGTVDSYDSRKDDTTAQENRSRTVSKGYWFMANGKEYRGYVIYSSDEAWPNLTNGETRFERIRYLNFFPYVNKPAMLSEFSEMGEMAIIYHIFAPIGCLLLLLLVIHTAKQEKKKKIATKKPAAPKIIEQKSDTDLYCRSCGNKLSQGTTLCPYCSTKTQENDIIACKSCGAVIPKGAEFCIECKKSVNSAMSNLNQSQCDVPLQNSKGLIGFSSRYTCCEILEAAQKNKKSSIWILMILVLVPLIGFPLAGFLMDDFSFGKSLVIGVGIALVMLIINLLALRKTNQPMWEGVVVNKYSKEKSEHRGGEDDNYRTYAEYTTIIYTDTGKKKTIVEKDSKRPMYDYLCVGDKVRFHPQFGTYEKYDKSKDRIIYCNVCSMMNPIQNDRCKRCNNLLFK